jgi:endonuclease/exonuclease/phosphatase (EEP) superfamily protein YafD
MSDSREAVTDDIFSMIQHNAVSRSPMRDRQEKDFTGTVGHHRSAFSAKKRVVIPSIRHTSTTVGVVVTAVSAYALTARYLPVSNHVLILTTALFPYLSSAAVVGMVLFVAAKRWLPAAIATGLLAAGLAVRLPLYLPADAPADGVHVRVLTANLRMGLADIDTVVSSATSSTDVLAVQELTPSAAHELSEGLAGSFPYRHIDARERAGGAGLWSRFPITDPRNIPGYNMAMITARIHVDGVPVDPTILVGHISGPWPQPIDDWRSEMHQADRTMQNIIDRTPDGPVLGMGDFNSTVDARPFRELLRNGYRDAGDQAGMGSPATYPADSLLPPLIAIDHVLTYRCTAISLRSVHVPGSDHRALAATLLLPTSPVSRGRDSDGVPER